MDLEEQQNEIQASIGRLLKKTTAWKLLGEGQSWTVDRSEKTGDHAERSPSQVKLQKDDKEPEITNSTHKKGKSGAKGDSYLKGDAPPDCTPVQLRLERNKHRKAKITDLTIIPKLVGGQGGENITGTLEAHVDGFRYTASSPNFCLDFRFDAVESSFYQVGDDRTLPLLHFRLHHYVMVGTEKTKDIQFHLSSTSYCWKTSASDSKNEKDGRPVDTDREINIFIEKVLSKWRFGLPFEEVKKKNEFHGVVFPSKASGVFALTRCSLVRLVEKPFIIVPLEEVELVYLEHVSPREIDMTVVFGDYNREVFRINSIPSKSVAQIKICLDIGHVKYYEDNKKQDWKSIMEGIKRRPRDFIDNGGWEFLNPNATAGCEAESSSEEDDDEYD